MRFRNHIKEQDDDYDEIVIRLRDPEKQMSKFLKAAKTAANIGHSYPVTIDGDDKEYKQDFYFDGDGPFYIKDIKINGEELK